MQRNWVKVVGHNPFSDSYMDNPYSPSIKQKNRERILQIQMATLQRIKANKKKRIV